jgi:hypothetical protein
MNRLVLSLLLVLLCIPMSLALVSVSHMGYHPDGAKTVTVYTHAPTGTYAIRNSAGIVVSQGTLGKAVDLAGNPVECQGNNPCLVADFSAFKTPGTYTIVATTDKVETSHTFTISPSIYKDNIGVFSEFFDALKQQGSPYHGDLNSFADPAFPQMADGSYIMTAHQAGATLVRLGSAYRRNPQLFDSRMAGTMKSYIVYLEGLQDVQVADDPNGFRLGEGMAISNAFIPGPTSKTTLDVYDSGGALIQTVPLRSLCAGLNGNAYTTCISNAASVYKCQENEPCINLTYNDRRGKRVAGQTDGYGVDNGWYYEWSCYFDVDLQNGNYNNGINPCMIYDVRESYDNTAVTLLAYTEALPALYQAGDASVQEVFNRALATHAYIKTNYALASDANAAAFYGAASFLLYDMTGDPAYLQDAYGVRAIASQQLVSDRARGNEFYWQEYVRHQNALTQNGMTYLVNGRDPASIFSDQMSFDYYNGGDLISMSKNGERIYQVYRHGAFQNSRQQLTESVLASKSLELAGGPAFASTISDAQLSWVTGNNGIEVTGNGADTFSSLSFIFGIGTSPQQFHSRLLMNSGYSAATAGKVVGIHDTGLKFKADDGSLVYLDGTSTILGYEFGGHGNLYNGEAQTSWLKAQTFKNGRSFIPGWINGAFNWNDNDDIYNYNDDRTAFEFTETENDMVSTAVEAFAYADARYNHVAYLAMPVLGSGNPIPPNDPNVTNSTSVSVNGTLRLTSTPLGADVWFDNVYRGVTDTTGYKVISDVTGAHTLKLALTGYQNETRAITFTPGSEQNLSIALTAVNASSNNTNTTTNTTPAVTGAPKILSTSMTNVTTQNGTNRIFENGIAGFTVQYNQTTSIVWYVNGVAVRSIVSDRDTFSWPPGVLYSDDSKVGTPANVRVVGNGVTNATFALTVFNVINPFWREPGGIVEVVTNNNAGNYTNMKVTLHDSTGFKTLVLTWRAADAAETTWQVQPSSYAEGNTFIHSVTVENNKTGVNVTYDVSAGNRAHYVQETSRSGGGGGGGGGGYKEPTRTFTDLNPTSDVAFALSAPEFVYATFSQDTVQKGGEVNLSIDAKDNEEVASVTAFLSNDAGEISSVPLRLSNGAKGYGTWAATLTNYPPGKHTLVEVNITDNDGLSVIAPVGDRAFYVIGDSVLASEHLLLVYAILDKSTINPGETITIKLDARDFLGVTAVNATLKSKDDTIIVPLSLVAGGSQYGTWEGKAKLTSSDATYALVSATLTNGNETREARVYAQKVYVQYVKPTEVAAAPQTVIERAGITQVLKHPVTPLIIGLIGMGLAMLIVSSMTFLRTEK